MFSKPSVTRWYCRAVLLLLFCLGLWYRAVSGLNYGELHLAIDAKVADSVSAVFARLPDGRLSALQRREESPWIFSQFYCPGACVGLVVEHTGPPPIAPVNMEVRFGEHWGLPSTRLPFILPADSVVLTGRSPGAASFQLVPQNSSFNFLCSQPFACNWQGDVWLVAVPALQCLWFWLICRVAGAFLRCSLVAAPGDLDERPDTLVKLEFLPVLGWGVSALRLFIILVLVHQIWCLLPGFLEIRWGIQLLLAVCVLFGLVISVILYLRWISCALTDRQVWRRVLTVAVVFFAVKSVFCWCFDATQSGDYDRYFRYGRAMATGDWGLIGDASVLTRSIFLERACVFTRPLMMLVGTSLTGIEFCLLLMETVTAVLMVFLTGRMFGLRAGALTLPFLLLYPPAVYSTWMVNVTTPGFFWMSIVFVQAEFLRGYLQKQLAIPLKGWQLAVFWCLCLLFCAAVAILDLVKTVGVFVSAAVLVSGLTWLLRLVSGPRYRVQRVLHVVTVSLLLLYFCGMLTRYWRAEIAEVCRERLGPSPPISMMSLLSAQDSTTDGSGPTISNWRFATLLNVPAGTASELNRRKLIHEKLAAGIDVWLHLFRKNRFLSFLHDSQNRVFGDRPGMKEGYMAWARVPWYSCLRLVTDGAYLLLLAGGVCRCVGGSGVGVRAAELFPLSFVVIQFAAILLLMEAGPYYVYVISYPLAWSCGLLLSRRHVVSMGQASGSAWAGMYPFCRPGRFLVILSMMCVGLWLHGLAGRWVYREGLAFLAPAIEASGTEAESALMKSSAVHVSAAMQPAGGRIAAGRQYRGRIVIPGAFRDSQLVCFLLTADARSRNLYYPRSFWEALPVTYELRVNGQHFRGGRLGELHPPKLQCLDQSLLRGQAGEDLHLEVILSAERDLDPSLIGFLPAIAVEYPYRPRVDPREELGVWERAAEVARREREAVKGSGQ